MAPGVVLGIDGSTGSERAVEWLAARSPDERIELVSIPGSKTPGAGDGARKEAAAERIRTLAPRASVVAGTSPRNEATTILEAAEGADLLVVGAPEGRDAGPLEAEVLASVGGHRRRFAVCFVPHAWKPTKGPVIVGLSGGTSRETLAVAAAEAARSRSVLTLAHAWQVPAPEYDGKLRIISSPLRARAAHGSLLRAATARLRLAYPDVACEGILVNDAHANALVHLASRASLLVIEAGADAGVARPLLRAVLHRGTCPVLIAPAPS